MNDADISVDMPENPEPNVQPEDPLPVNEGVDEMPDEVEEEDAKMEMKIKEIVPDNEVFNDAMEQAPPKRKKRPISDKQREHLAKIRVKALEAKKAKKANKPQVKSAKKVYEQQIEEEYDHEVPKGNILNMPTPDKDSSLVHLTQEQLRQLQFEAIYGYDTMRKERKADKRKKQAQEQHEQQTYQAVHRAVNRQVDDDGWGVCFQ